MTAIYCGQLGADLDRLLALLGLRPDNTHVPGTLVAQVEGNHDTVELAELSGGGELAKPRCRVSGRGGTAAGPAPGSDGLARAHSSCR